MSAIKKLSFSDFDDETKALEEQLKILEEQGICINHDSDDSRSNQVKACGTS